MHQITLQSNIIINNMLTKSLLFLSRKLFSTDKLKAIENNIKRITEQYAKIQKQKMDNTTLHQLNHKMQQLQYHLKLKKILVEQKHKQEKQLPLIRKDINKRSHLIKNQNQEETKSKSERFIPNNITLNKLYHNEQEILLVGVEKTNLEHSLFVKDLLNRLQITVASTTIPPDSPFLIKSQGSYQEVWKEFLNGKNHNFYLSTKPRFLQQLTLEQVKINALKHSLKQDSQFQLQIVYMLEYSERYKKFLPNSFFAPFFHQNIKNIIFSDYPMLKQREYQVNNMSLDKLRQLFKFYVTQFQANKTYFDPRLLHYEEMLKPKIQYIAEVIKKTSYLEKRTLAICENQYTDLICQYWKTATKSVDLFDIEIPDLKMPFIQFIEKLVILDLMLQPIVQKHFIRHKSFPFKLANKIGANNFINSLFVIWDFYYRQYQKAKYPEISKSDFVSDVLTPKTEKPRTPIY